MNKEETIEFIMKYKDCIYHRDKNAKESIDIDRLMENITQKRDIHSHLGLTISGQIYGYRIYDSVFPECRTIDLIYYIDVAKMKIIDRKEKIQSIAQ